MRKAYFGWRADHGGIWCAQIVYDDIPKPTKELQENFSTFHLIGEDCCDEAGVPDMAKCEAKYAEAKPKSKSLRMEKMP